MTIGDKAKGSIKACITHKSMSHLEGTSAALNSKGTYTSTGMVTAHKSPQIGHGKTHPHKLRGRRFCAAFLVCVPLQGLPIASMCKEHIVKRAHCLIDTTFNQ